MTVSTNDELHSRFDRVVYAPRRGGQDTAYWEEEWSRVDLRAALERVDTQPDPTIRLLDRLVPRGGRVLEAGCGSGVITQHLAGIGCDIIGIDLAMESLGRAKAEWDGIRLLRGDVRSMPFPDGCFDAIVSLGVVEHLKGTVVDALREHRRVISGSGRLLISLPRISPVKLMKDVVQLDARRLGSYPARRRLVTRSGASQPEGHAFHQYELTKRTFTRWLTQSGFRVESWHPHLVNAGLGELPFLRGSTDVDESPGRESAPSAVSAGGTDQTWMTAMKRAITREEGHDLPTTMIARLSALSLGHMLMAVATPV